MVRLSRALEDFKSSGRTSPPLPTFPPSLLLLLLLPPSPSPLESRYQPGAVVFLDFGRGN